MWFRRPPRSPGLRLLAVVALSIAVPSATCFRLNRSPSLPAGVYFLVPAFLSRPLDQGDLALVCPPSIIAAVARARGYVGFGLCPGFVPELLKPIGGLPGDRVAVQDHFVRVNGARVPGALVLAQDSLGRALAPFSHSELEVPADSVFLLSTHSPRSWDSRYYGPVPRSHLRARAVLLWSLEP